MIMKINIKFIYSTILTNNQTWSTKEIKALIGFVNLHIRDMKEIPAMYKMFEYLVPR